MKIVLAALLASVLVAPSAPIPPSSVGSCTVYGVQKQVQSEKMDFTGIYPQFSGIQDRNKQTVLNNRMREWQKCATARAQAAVLTLQNGDGPKNVVEAVYNYEVKRNSNGLVSLLFSDYLYAGGANGIDRKRGLTFSSVTGEELELSDFFKSDASYKDVLNRRIGEQLRSRGLESQLLATYTGLTGGETYYITDDALVIVVREKTWFDYAMGTVEFSIPFSELQVYLKEDILL